jgi:hypothetical protein
MDVAENGLTAGADLIEISIAEKEEEGILEIRIKDNGRGMPEDRVEQACDPFFTTRTTRRVGLGLSLFEEAARRSGGRFDIRSVEGKGTEVLASFQLHHIDRAPLGDMIKTMLSLIVGNPMADFAYTHNVDGKSFQLDTRKIKAELEGVPIHHPEVIKYLSEVMKDSLDELKADAGSGGGTWQN